MSAFLFCHTFLYNILIADNGNYAAAYHQSILTAFNAHGITVPMPSAPQNLRVTNTTYTPINLAWDANPPGEQISLYEVWRYVEYESDWEVIGTTTSTSYTDNNYVWLPSGNSDIDYKIRAKDIINLYSAYSSIASTEGEWMGKRSGDGEGAISDASTPPNRFILVQNYPNPFNPESRIDFGLPEAASVRMMISDLLGRQVLLIDEKEFSKGVHNFVWTGKDGLGNKVVSGVYFLRFDAVGESGQRFKKVVKMLLAK